jgi:hypothetical protein
VRVDGQRAVGMQHLPATWILAAADVEAGLTCCDIALVRCLSLHGCCIMLVLSACAMHGCIGMAACSCFGCLYERFVAEADL